MLFAIDRRTALMLAQPPADAIAALLGFGLPISVSPVIPAALSVALIRRSALPSMPANWPAKAGRTAGSAWRTYPLGAAIPRTEPMNSPAPSGAFRNDQQRNRPIGLRGRWTPRDRYSRGNCWPRRRNSRFSRRWRRQHERRYARSWPRSIATALKKAGATMIGQNDGHAIAKRGARLLSEADPLRAARVLFDGLKLQPPGSRAAVIRWLTEELLRHDPGSIAGVVADLHRMAHRKPGDRG